MQLVCHHVGRSLAGNLNFLLLTAMPARIKAAGCGQHVRVWQLWTFVCIHPPPPYATGLLAAVAEGPRATEQFAAVVAVFVAGLAASARAQDISARFLEHLARRLEQVGGQVM